jgi:hypothetical protein
MKILSSSTYLQEYKNCNGQKPLWYVKHFVRGFFCPNNNEIYINKDAIYINKRDYELLIKHEKGHKEGKEHTIFGIMSPNSLIRYLTS